jgi:hypothetical protein
VVAQVLGPLLERPHETQDGLKCFYNTAAQGGGGPSYALTVATRSGFEAAKSFAEGVAQSGTGAARVSTVHDLGSDTFSVSSDSGGPDYSLWAVKAGFGIEVNVNDLGQGVNRAHDLAAAALSRLLRARPPRSAWDSRESPAGNRTRRRRSPPGSGRRWISSAIAIWHTRFPPDGDPLCGREGQVRVKMHLACTSDGPRMATAATGASEAAPDRVGLACRAECSPR